MKIIHLDTEPTWRGGERQIELLVRGLVSYGTENYLGVFGGGELYRRLGEDFPCFVFKYRNFLSLGEIWRLKRYCELHEIQIVDAHSAKGHVLGLLLCWLLPHLKFIVHRRVDFLPKSGWVNRQKYLSKKIDRYVAISQEIARVLGIFGIDAAKISVVQSAVPLPQFSQEERDNARREVAKKWQIDLKNPLLINIAYLTTQKGHHVLLRALKYCKEAGMPFTCLIAGDGPLFKDLTSLATELRFSSSEVKFLGVQSDVRLLYLAADIFVMPSEYEGLGTSLLDAMGYRLPIVATNVGGIPEIVHQGINGMLVERGDEKKLANALQLLMTEVDLRGRFGNAGYLMLKEQFQVEKMVAGNWAIYNQVLAAERPE